MRTAAPGTALNKLYLDRVKDNPDALVATPQDAADRLIVEGENTAYFGGGYVFADDPRVQPLWDLPDEITDQLAFGFPKNSELTPIFNHAIQEMNQAGLMRRIGNEWW